MNKGLSEGNSPSHRWAGINKEQGLCPSTSKKSEDQGHAQPRKKQRTHCGEGRNQAVRHEESLGEPTWVNG